MSVRIIYSGAWIQRRYKFYLLKLLELMVMYISVTNRIENLIENICIFLQSKTLRECFVSKANYIILPFAVETLGPWCKDAIKFIDALGKLLISSTGEVRSKEFFRKIISLPIQRGNAASIMQSFPSESKIAESFYIIYLHL